MTNIALGRVSVVSILSLSAAIVVSVLIIFSALDQSNFGVSSVERFAYGLVYIGVLFAASTVMRRTFLIRAEWQAIGLWFLLAALFLVPTIVQRYFYPTYIIGDAASILLPAIIIVAAGNSEHLFSNRYISILSAGMLLGALLAPMVGAEGARFEPPPTLLIALTWWGVLSTKRADHRGLLFVVALLVGFLALESGQRTALLIWLLCGLYAAWRIVPAGRLRILIIGAAVAVIVGIPGTAVRDAATNALAGYRVAAVLQGTSDDSLLSRANEVRVVASNLVEHGTPLSWVIGFGHGATYRPASSSTSRNVTSLGRVHNVHIGPMLIAFRYGLVGIVAYAALAIVVIRALVGRADRVKSREPLGAFALATAAYLVEGLMFNVLADPLFSFSVAGVLNGLLRREVAPDRVHRALTKTPAYGENQ